MTWETVIGLEVHVQLKTKSKLFSGSPTTFGAPPNTQTSFIDAGLPGVLPVFNQEALYMAVKLGLAIQGEINDHSFFERKNYFYPDLPKGYQISQYQKPIVSNGCLTIKLNDNTNKTITIARAHLEEDAGKSIHDIHPNYSGIDLNRAGTPLLEIVTTPCLSSSEEAVAYLKALHQLVRFLGICDGNMQEGSFRCDVNLSLRPEGANYLGTRTELKNLNSFRFIEKAIRFEQLRHQDLLECGKEIIQETRLYSPDSNTTFPMRSKENENDYRYFPDPDLLPIHISSEVLDAIKQTMPPLPSEIKEHLITEEQLNEEEAEYLLSSPALYSFFTAIKKLNPTSSKQILNWLKGPYASILNALNKTLDDQLITPQDFSVLLTALQQNKISANNGKKMLQQALEQNKNLPDLLRECEKVSTASELNLDAIVRKLIEQYPQQVAEFRAGKEKLIAFFVGQVMKQTKGAADPGEINKTLLNFLKVKE